MGNHLHVRRHVAFRCELCCFSADKALKTFRVEMRSTSYMLVKTGCVQFRVSYASGCAVGIIFMACPWAKVIYAGMFAVPLL